MKRSIITVVTVAVLTIGITGCFPSSSSTPKSSTGVTQAQAKVKTQADGYTVEQGNIKRRVELENAPGAIKHMYIISAMSGDVLIYSTIKGKPTSSGKRLSPYSVVATDGQYVDSSSRGVKVNIGGSTHYTPEVLQDDGTYGSSISYLYWWDARDIYHQQYVTGGVMIHISDQVMNFPKIILNLEEVS